MNCENCGEEIEEKMISRGIVYAHKNGGTLCNKEGLPKYASASPDWTIDNRRMEIISQLNRGSNEFPELIKEIFYFDKKLKCWTNKKDRGLI